MSARELLINTLARIPFREVLLFAVLATASVLVVQGVAQLHQAAAYIVGGLLTAGLGLLFLAEAD